MTVHYRSLKKKVVEIISFNRVFKSYGKVWALQDLSFSILKGETVALVGKNGCGKTTTVNVLCNLLPYDKGEVKVFNQRVTPNHVSYKNRLGVLLSPPIFVNEFTVFEYLKFVGRFQGVTVSELMQRIEDLVNQFDINDYRKRRISDYSAGNKMKIALTAALIHNPETIILDEPFVHLDIQMIDLLLKLLHSIKKTKTIFITSQNTDLVLRLSDRILIMDEGKIIENLLTSDSSSTDNIQQVIREAVIGEVNAQKLKWLR